jgi:hypothetical protein
MARRVHRECTSCVEQDGGVSFTVHATRKLLDRVKPPVLRSVTDPTPQLGNWYATVLFWKPQVALFVNERTLLPMLTPLAPAATLLDRFPRALAEVLHAHRLADAFVRSEIAALVDGSYARTENRSVVGIMNEFSYLARVHRDDYADDLLALSVVLSRTPCSPLYKRHVSPDRELAAFGAGVPRIMVRGADSGATPP